MVRQFKVGEHLFHCGTESGLEGFSSAVGYFAAPNIFDEKVFAEGFSQIEDFLKSQNVKTVLGPFSGNTLFPYRYRTSHFTESPFWGEPSNDQEVVQWIQNRGYQESAVYHSSRIKNDDELKAKMTDLHKNLPKMAIKDFSVQVCDSSVWQKFETDIYQLTLESFKSNYLFKPYSFEQFHQVYDPLFKAQGLVSPSSLLLMEKSKPVGFCFNFEDQKNTYLKTIGVHPNSRRLGASFLYLMTESFHRVSPAKDLILCLMKQGNLPDLFSDRMVLEKRSYALFQKSL